MPTNKAYIDQYLAAQHVVVIATVGDSRSPWVFSVYYTYTSGMFLFVSSGESKHSRLIKDGASVGFVVTDTTQKPPTSAHGIQGTGLARPAKFKEYPLFVRYYARMFPKYGANMESAETLRDTLAHAATARPYVLIPTTVKLTDKRFCKDPITIECSPGSDE